MRLVHVFGGFTHYVEPPREPRFRRSFDFNNVPSRGDSNRLRQLAQVRRLVRLECSRPSGELEPRWGALARAPSRPPSRRLFLDVLAALDSRRLLQRPRDSLSRGSFPSRLLSLAG